MQVEDTRGFAPYSHFFSPRSRRYYFKPNLKLLVALLPYLHREGPPTRVVCPMAGAGAAPVLTLAFYRGATRVVAWEEDSFWRPVCEENLARNSFCKGRYEILPPEMWGPADGAVLATAPKPKFSHVQKWYEALSRNLLELSRCMVEGAIVIVSERVDQGYREYVYTENLITSALHRSFGRARVAEVGEVETQQSDQQNNIERQVFVVAEVT